MRMPGSIGPSALFARLRLAVRCIRPTSRLINGRPMDGPIAFLSCVPALYAYACFPY